MVSNISRSLLRKQIKNIGMPNKIFLAACALLLAAGACTRDEAGPVEKDAIAPGPVRNLTVENLHGAAKIGFELPEDKDLQYIKARYTTPAGVIRETKVSRYNRSLTMEGFGDTSRYTITLFTVDKSENESQPVEITVKPLEPPIWLVRKTLAMKPDFGGVNVSFTNNGEKDLAFVVLSDDSLGQFSPITTQYTKLKQGEFSTRNKPNKPTRFGVYIRDRWGNLSDTMITVLTPYFEEMLDRTKMRGLALPTDAPLGTMHLGTIGGLFDGNTESGFYHSADNGHMPQWFTYDMGVSAKLSRLVWFMRPGNYFTMHNPRVVEIWGSNNPDPNGSFDSWVLLTTHTQTKPSGLPEGQLSQDDMDAGKNGNTVTFPLDMPKVRYIRFKTLKNWSNGTYVQLFEIKMYGDSH